MEKIKKHIKNNSPWTVEKEWELIREMGGATKWGDDYYITYNYEVVCDKIDAAMAELADETDQDELREKMKNLRANI